MLEEGVKKGWGVGKPIRNDGKIKEYKENYVKGTRERKGALDKTRWKDATGEGKQALREKIAASRKVWAQQMRAHQKEVHARIKEIREEFKNNRDEVIDGNKPGE